MPNFSTRHSTRHSAAQMFALVADVECYPEFLPMCEGLTIRECRSRNHKMLLIADMTVGYKLIRESFTSQVLIDPSNLVIEVKYLNGPFRYLENRWSFHPSEEKICLPVSIAEQAPSFTSIPWGADKHHDHKSTPDMPSWAYNQGCSVAFFLDYEFKNKMLGIVMGSMFDIAFRKFSNAFERRADAIYGQVL
ncbi:type II toxin-antitoxin system RatA family toxin [Bartonella sp. DGB2]|uniref:type II toxin-antitoxin system RatA family toxin n=1 Tax=Bartonella sp. DGB2 TaxID=3388426 RepID=UPI00398FA512